MALLLGAPINSVINNSPTLGHTAASHWHLDEQPSPSSRFLSSHASPLSTTPSPHTGFFTQLTATHHKPVPHAVPSARLLWPQPLAGSQKSLVHALESVQTTAVPATQLPVLHLSPTVHTLPSASHAVLSLGAGSKAHRPLLWSQASAVQSLPSLQFLYGPATHNLPLHWSFCVHALSSASHVATFAMFTQPLSGEQASSVHGFLSSQESNAPAVHCPSLHVSLMVHALPSASQALPLAALSISHLPLLELQVFFTHGPSPPLVQLTTVAGLTLHWFTPPLVSQKSVPLQKFPSSSLAQSSLFWHWHVLVPDLHAPPSHLSPIVQLLPSLQLWVFAVFTQPLAGAQVSVVHGLPSPHTSATTIAVPLHLLFWQVSPLVHAFLSSQGEFAASCLQPLMASQVSKVQPFLSSQSTGVPMQLPSVHASALVHAVPSLQEVPANFRTSLHCPLLDSHDHVAHAVLSAQTLTVPDLHSPPAQESPTVHSVPSEHGKPSSLLLKQPLLGSQPSVVHGLPSSQFFSDPTTHMPPWQLSLTVQLLPSASQDPAALLCRQFWALSSQTSVVQAFLSSQVPSSTWPLQLSSWPLQVSVWMLALHAVRPPGPHERAPLHEPMTWPLSSLASAKQEVDNWSVLAAALHAQVPPLGWHWEIELPSTLLPLLQV